MRVFRNWKRYFEAVIIIVCMIIIGGCSKKEEQECVAVSYTHLPALIIIRTIIT